MSRIAALLIFLCLAACGTKGTLELPPGPVPQPLLSSNEPAVADANTLSNQSDQ